MPDFPKNCRVGQPVKDFIPGFGARTTDAWRTPASPQTGPFDTSRTSYDVDGDGKADVHVTRVHLAGRVAGAIDRFSVEEDLGEKAAVLFGDYAGRVYLERRVRADGSFVDARDEDGDGKVDLLVKGKFNALTLRLTGKAAEIAARTAFDDE